MRDGDRVRSQCDYEVVGLGWEPVRVWVVGVGAFGERGSGEDLGAS